MYRHANSRQDSAATYPYKRSHLMALRATKISASDPPSTLWPASGEHHDRHSDVCNFYSITTNQGIARDRVDRPKSRRPKD